MKIVRNEKGSIDFKIKIANHYVTVATLVPPFFISSKKYSLYFYYYGEEFNKGAYACSHFNGNVSITIRRREYECLEDFIERVEKIVIKKLYLIGSSIIEEIKQVENKEAIKNILMY